MKITEDKQDNKTARLTMSKEIWTRSFGCNCALKTDLLRVFFRAINLERFLAGYRRIH